MPGSGRPSEKGMATHSSILAWRILWTEEPGVQELDTAGELTFSVSYVLQSQHHEKFCVLFKIFNVTFQYIFLLYL